MNKDTRKRDWLLGILFSFSLITAVLISSFEIAMYADFGFYQKEYEKYKVLPELDMEMDDVMHVTQMCIRDRLQMKPIILLNLSDLES